MKKRIIFSIIGLLIMTGVLGGIKGLQINRMIAQGTASALITGGPGNDRLTGSLGTTRINAIDGTGGDTVVCRSMQTYVAADVGDKLIGTCTVVTLRTPSVGNVTG